MKQSAKVIHFNTTDLFNIKFLLPFFLPWLEDKDASLIKEQPESHEKAGKPNVYSNNVLSRDRIYMPSQL